MFSREGETGIMTTIGRTDASADRGSGGPALTACLLAVGLCDLAVLSSWMAGHLPAVAALLAHASLACGVYLFGAVGSERAGAAIAAVCMLAMGPLGALGSCVLMRGAGRSHLAAQPGADRDRPSPHPDPVGWISEPLREKRAFVPREASMRPFSEILAKGNLGEKQALLGAMSTRFHPDQMPVLKAALRSDEAPVRVSAAAVFAKLREVNRSPLSGGADAGGEDAVATARKLADAAWSGLLSAAEAELAREKAVEILSAQAQSAAQPDCVEAFLCRLLLESSRDDEVENRLGPQAHALPPELKSILLRARMRRRRYDTIATLAGPREGTATPLDRHGRPARQRPLLAASREGAEMPGGTALDIAPPRPGRGSGGL